MAGIDYVPKTIFIQTNYKSDHEQISDVVKRSVKLFWNGLPEKTRNSISYPSYKIQCLTSRDNGVKSYTGKAYVYFSDMRILNAIRGLNVDGSERVELIENPDFIPTEEEAKQLGEIRKAIAQLDLVRLDPSSFADPDKMSDWSYCDEDIIHDEEVKIEVLQGKMNKDAYIKRRCDSLFKFLPVIKYDGEEVDERDLEVGFKNITYPLYYGDKELKDTLFLHFPNGPGSITEDDIYEHMLKFIPANERPSVHMNPDKRNCILVWKTELGAVDFMGIFRKVIIRDDKCIISSLSKFPPVEKNDAKRNYPQQNNGGSYQRDEQRNGYRGRGRNNFKRSDDRTPLSDIRESRSLPNNGERGARTPPRSPQFGGGYKTVSYNRRDTRMTKSTGGLEN